MSKESPSKKKNFSYPKTKILILLLEGVHSATVDQFSKAQYSVELCAQALSEEELIARIPGVHILGIRSKTSVTKKVLDHASQLLTIGCFCIGTNQVDVRAATSKGIPVFNAPFANTRSVAELVMAEIVILARKIFDKSSALHQWRWMKTAEQSYEVRGKTIGIVGYGHIGGQVGLLAESFGMKVLYYDVEKKLSLGNAQQMATLKQVLKQADFVTLHVPETAATKNMIAQDEIQAMKKGSYLLNLSRGTVVNIKAVKKFLSSGHLAGGAFDVFPEEPKSNEEKFESELCGLENVILTPHIGGSTLEAQKNIGIEVADSLINYLDLGSSTGSVNFPAVTLPVMQDSHRVLNIHKNVPGVLHKITGIVADMGANIQSQYLSTFGDIGYLIMDVDTHLSTKVKAAIDGMEENIRTRVLY